LEVSHCGAAQPRKRPAHKPSPGCFAPRATVIEKRSRHINRPPATSGWAATFWVNLRTLPHTNLARLHTGRYRDFVLAKRIAETYPTELDKGDGTHRFTLMAHHAGSKARVIVQIEGHEAPISEGPESKSSHRQEMGWWMEVPSPTPPPRCSSIWLQWSSRICATGPNRTPRRRAWAMAVALTSPPSAQSSHNRTITAVTSNQAAPRPSKPTTAVGPRQYQADSPCGVPRR